jgi:hypothetical protein
MAPTVNKTRLAHYLEAYQPLEQDLQDRIWDRVFRASWSPDDPMSLQIAHDVIQESRLASAGAKMAALPGQLDKAVQSALDKVEASRARAAMADRQAIAAQVARAATHALQITLPRFERAVHRRTAQRLVLMLAILSFVMGIGGYIWGRHDTGQFEEKLAELAARADAKTWIRLLEVNGNLDSNLSKACAPGGSGFILAPEGRHACAVPLWLDAPDRPTPGPLTAMDFATDHLASLRSRSSFFVILALGALLGAGLQQFFRWMGQR